MATEKLLKAIITGPPDKLDDTIMQLVLDGGFHVTSATTTLKALGGLSVPEGDNPYRAPLDQTEELMQRLGVKPEYVPAEEWRFTLDDTAAFLGRVSGAYSRLSAHKNSEASFIQSSKELLRRMEPFSELQVDLVALLNVRNLELRFGSIELEDYPELLAAANRRSDVFLFRSGAKGERAYCIYLTSKGQADSVAEFFEDRDFVFEELPASSDFEGVPAERIKTITAQIAVANTKTGEIAKELTAFLADIRHELCARHSWLQFMNRAFELREDAAIKGEVFYVTGWVPAASAGETLLAAAELGVECELERPKKIDHGHVPVLFKSGFLSGIFAPFVEMYGYPAYGEVDPRSFMAVTYALLFGIMFGDVGQGLGLVLVGLFLKKSRGMWLGGIIAWVGGFATLFGFVYGSVFGNEHLLPGFKVMEDGNMMTMLIITVVVGCALIVACMAMNIITGFRQRNMKKALFSANGVFGAVFFISIIAAGANLFVSGRNLFTTPMFLIVCIIIPLLCIFCSEPLSKFFEGHRRCAPESWGLFFIEGFFEIFEACLSWFSNCISFLRVGAYAICHAGMMMIVYLLSASDGGGYNILGLIFGNILVMVVEAVLVCIQVLRLEYYEMFGRFYTGLGFPFDPASVEYKV